MLPSRSQTLLSSHFSVRVGRGVQCTEPWIIKLLFRLFPMECTMLLNLHTYSPTPRKHQRFSLLSRCRCCRRMVVPTSSLCPKAKATSILNPKPNLSPRSGLNSVSSSEPSRHLQLSSLLNHASKPFAAMLFSIALSFIPNPYSDLYAIAVPATTTSQSVMKSKKQDSSDDHEFSVYTKRLLEFVPILEQRIKEVKEEKGEIRLVKEALKDVREKRKEIQNDIMDNLRKELEQLGNDKVQYLSKAETILDAALPVRKELSDLVRREKARRADNEGDVAIRERERVEELERRLERLEREFNGLTEKAEELNQRIEMRERFTFSVGIREILFSERECEELVEKLNQWLEQKEMERKMKNKYSKLSPEDLKKDLEAAQSSYIEQTLLPKSISNSDSNSNLSFETSTQRLATRIRHTLEESKQIQRNLENQIRKKMRAYGEEWRYVVKTSDSEVMKGFPEFELIWKFGDKEVVNPNAVQLGDFHGWAKWREKERAKLKKEILALENEEFRREYMTRFKEKLILDRERVVAKTWYNERRKRWEIEPIVVPYAVSRKLVRAARIRHDWAVMYLSLKGDAKEYYVNIKEYDELFKDFGCFDGLYLELQAAGVPTIVQFMPVRLADLDMRQAICAVMDFIYWCFTILSEFISWTYVRDWFFPRLMEAIDEFMMLIGFPLIEFLIPKKN